MSNNARLEALEFKCAHLEKAVQELSDMVYRQQQELDRALLRSRDVALQLAALEAAADPAAGSGTELPPHY